MGFYFLLIGTVGLILCFAFTFFFFSMHKIIFLLVLYFCFDVKFDLYIWKIDLHYLSSVRDLH